MDDDQHPIARPRRRGGLRHDGRADRPPGAGGHLLGLLDGRALPTSVLATEVGWPRSTAGAHLTRLRRLASSRTP